MQPYTTDGVNFLSQESEERIEAVYGDTYDRVVDVKNRYDPQNVFSLNQNVEPTV